MRHPVERVDEHDLQLVWHFSQYVPSEEATLPVGQLETHSNSLFFNYAEEGHASQLETPHFRQLLEHRVQISSNFLGVTSQLSTQLAEDRVQEVDPLTEFPRYPESQKRHLSSSQTPALGY